MQSDITWVKENEYRKEANYILTTFTLCASIGEYRKHSERDKVEVEKESLPKNVCDTWIRNLRAQVPHVMYVYTENEGAGEKEKESILIARSLRSTVFSQLN